MLSAEALAAAHRCAMEAPPVTPEQKALLRELLTAVRPAERRAAA
ncbi:hypothetical protein [Gordonia sp. (in: high G+C Gram-positive bacteria)]